MPPTAYSQTSPTWARDSNQRATGSFCSLAVGGIGARAAAIVRTALITAHK
jgi:hypothetical protein